MALRPASADVAGAVVSARPLRAAQLTKPNIARARIGTVPSFYSIKVRTNTEFPLPVFSVPLCALCVKSFSCLEHGFNTEYSEGTEDTEKNLDGENRAIYIE